MTTPPTTQPERDRLAARVRADETLAVALEQGGWIADVLTVEALEAADTVPPRTFANVRAWGAVWRFVGWTVGLFACVLAGLVIYALVFGGTVPPDAPVVLGAFP